MLTSFFFYIHIFYYISEFQREKIERQKQAALNRLKERREMEEKMRMEAEEEENDEREAELAMIHALQNVESDCNNRMEIDDTL